MKRLIGGCLWIMLVTLASSYVTVMLKTTNGEPVTPNKVTTDLEHKKMVPINVPIIANGTLEGYIVAQFTYLADPSALRALSVPPDSFITDEAFRTLYSTDLNFNHLEKYDLQGLTKSLVKKINQRLGGEVVKDLLVEEFTYVAKREISK